MSPCLEAKIVNGLSDPRPVMLILLLYRIPNSLSGIDTAIEHGSFNMEGYRVVALSEYPEFGLFRDKVPSRLQYLFRSLRDP